MANDGWFWILQLHEMTMQSSGSERSANSIRSEDEHEDLEKQQNSAGDSMGSAAVEHRNQLSSGCSGRGRNHRRLRCSPTLLRYLEFCDVRRQLARSEEPTNTAIHEFEEVREEFEGYLRESLQSQRNGTADVNLAAEHESAVFEIPTSDDYLTMPDAQAFHVVENGEKTEEEIESEINQFTFKLADIGWRSLKDHFDAFFSLAKINSKIKRVDLSLQAVRRLLECFDLLLNGSVRTVIKRIIQIQGQPSDDVKNEATTIANYLLMLIYLLSRLSFHLEAEHMKRLLAMEKKKGARKIELDKDMETWVTLRSRMLESFTELCDLQLPDYSRQMRPGVIKYLWRPPEANKGMVMAFIETIFKFLDNPSNKAAASLRWLETLFSLVQVICIRFDYFSRMAVALVEKTVNLEYLREATANKYPFIQAIINVSQNADMDVLLEHMVHHLGDMLNHDFSTTSTKPYSLLMTTMAEYAPDIMIKQLSAILPYLKNDTPQLRSCVLQCFSHLLCSPKLSEANCLQFSRLFKVRNRMLEFCRDHLQDENATVRCKAIQVWTNLAEAGRIPPEELQKSLVYTVGDRLLDKSLVCRKAALQFLFKFLEGNPYGHDFNYNLHVTDRQLCRCSATAGSQIDSCGATRGPQIDSCVAGAPHEGHLITFLSRQEEDWGRFDWT